MMKTALIYVKHFLIVTCILLGLGFAILVSQKGSIGFGVDDLAFKVGGEGPHVFFSPEGPEALYIRGSSEDGFKREIIRSPFSQALPVYFALDDSTFYVTPNSTIETPVSVYEDNQPILALSDLEGNFKTFKDFLINHGVINSALEWTFGKGHLVLVGDMVDRGFSTTQLLWLVYKLEQEANASGGMVHYIIGNHEIKNLQGNFRSAASKYFAISGLLGKQQFELFSDEALLGRWLASKNVIERINGILFVHGGLHPDIASTDLTIDDVNRTVRSHYRHFYYPKPNHDNIEKLLTSNKTGPAWYRGFFKGEVTQEEYERGLTHFDSDAIVVGHTIQFKVNPQFNNKLFAIDVKLPN